MSDDWNPTGAGKIRLSVAPGTQQIIGNSGDRPLHLRQDEGMSLHNRFVFPAGVTEIIVRPHGTAVFVAQKPSRWYRLWCWLTRRIPKLRWRYQHWTERKEMSDR
jgi:hypothetical protein